MTTATARETREATSVTAPVGEVFSSTSMVFTLGTLAAISGLLLAITYHATFERIQRNRELALQAAVFTVVPGADEQRPFEVQPDGTLIPFVAGGDAGGVLIYGGYKEGALVGVALPASGQGYADIIRVLYGYDPERQMVVGFKVLENKETPGLGNKIAVEPFVTNFTALDATLDAGGGKLAHPLELVKNGQKQDAWEVDGISGATISSKAVTRMLDASMSEMLPIIQKQLPVLRGEG